MIKTTLIENDMIKQSHVMFVTAGYADGIIQYWYTDDSIKSIIEWWHSDTFDGPTNDDYLLALYVHGDKVFDYIELFNEGISRCICNFEQLFTILKPMENKNTEVSFRCAGKLYTFYDAQNVAEEWKNNLFPSNVIEDTRIYDVPVNIRTLRDLVEFLDVSGKQAGALAEWDDQKEIENEKDAMHGFTEPDLKKALDEANNTIDSLLHTLADNVTHGDDGSYLLYLPNGYALHYSCPQSVQSVGDKHRWTMRKRFGGQILRGKGVARFERESTTYSDDFNLDAIKNAVLIATSIPEYKVGDVVVYSERSYYVIDVFDGSAKLFDPERKNVIVVNDLFRIDRIGYSALADQVFSGGIS